MLSSKTSILQDRSRVQVGGILGQALDSSANGRLKQFIQDEESEAIRIYRRDRVQRSLSEGWKGECAGKWLHAASHCAMRTGDQEITGHLRTVADFLVAQQDADGYLGTYNAVRRFNGTEKKPRQTYDLWMNAWVMQGLVDVWRLFGDKKYLAAASRIGDLCIRTYTKDDRRIVDAAPFGGTGSACVMVNFVDLYQTTGKKKYLDFAEFCLQALEQRPGTEIITRTLLNYDAAQINEGKHYEMLDCYLGIAELYRVTGNKTYLQVIQNAWNEVHQYHENAAGAPCGGVGIHPECYNVRYMFSPYAFSETCSMMDWLRLNISLLQITGEARYAEQIEKIAYNAMLGAQFPDGFGWIYHSIMNGRRNRTGEFACCTSSGTIALEEVPPAIFSAIPEGVQINVFGPARASLAHRGVTIDVEQVTRYPFDGLVTVKLNPERKLKCTLAVRVPSWIGRSAVRVNGRKVKAAAGTFHPITRVWAPGDEIELMLPMPLHLAERVAEYNHKGEYIDERIPYCAIYKGPLLYATEWKDTLDAPNPIVVRDGFDVADLREVPAPEGVEGSAYEVKGAGRAHVFVPYYAVGNREDETCHTTWLRRPQPPARHAAPRRRGR